MQFQFRPGKGSILAAIGVMFFNPAHAFDNGPAEQYKTYLTKAQTIDPVGDFGEQISLREGKLSFRNVDIEVPGIGPTIRIVRTAQLDEGYGTRMSSGNAVGGWEIEIPRLKTVTADPVGGIHSQPLSADSPIGWQVPGPDMNARCSNFNKPPRVSYGNTLVEFYPANWWFGYQLVDDGGNEHAVAARTAGLPGPQYTLGTTTGHWVIACLPQTSNGEPGDAFQAIAPDGTKYWLDRLTYSAYGGLTMPFEEMPPKDLTYYYTLPRKSAAMLVTRVEDRFGNWLKYNYSGSRVTSIDASDGRKVTLVWQTDGLTITVGTGIATRTWTYVASGSNSLQVTQPDGSKWQYSGEFHLPRISNYVSEGCSQGGLGFEQTGTRQVSVSAPSGATATFALKQRFFGRAYVPKYCSEPPQLGVPDPGYALLAKAWLSYAMTTKTVTGPGLPTMTWNYSYSPHNANWLEDCPNNSCPAEVWTDVVDPHGDKVRSTFSNRWDQTENKLLREDTYDNGQLLSTATYTYATTPSNGTNPYPWPLFVAGFTNYNANWEADQRWTPVKRRVVTQQGTTYTWQANAFDAFANPVDVTRSSTPGGYSRTDLTAYHHNLSKWVIGQIASSTNTNTGLVESATGYNANALPQLTVAFGKAQQFFLYNTDGTLASVTDGNDHTTTFANWKRGIPQKITFADATFKTAVVNDLGGIDSATDENGYKTCYGYDAMGRVNLITYPSEAANGVCDTSAWNATHIEFVRVAASEYGLSAGHWRQRIWTGNGHKHTYYDAFWRPVLVREFDSGNPAGTLRETVTRYDSDGRAVFQSYPTRGVTDIEQ